MCSISTSYEEILNDKKQQGSVDRYSCFKERDSYGIFHTVLNTPSSLHVMPLPRYDSSCTMRNVISYRPPTGTPLFRKLLRANNSKSNELNLRIMKILQNFENIEFLISIMFASKESIKVTKTNQCNSTVTQTIEVPSPLKNTVENLSNTIRPRIEVLENQLDHIEDIVRNCVNEFHMLAIETRNLKQDNLKNIDIINQLETIVDELSFDRDRFLQENTNLIKKVAAKKNTIRDLHRNVDMVIKRNVKLENDNRALQSFIERAGAIHKGFNDILSRYDRRCCCIMKENDEIAKMCKELRTRITEYESKHELGTPNRKITLNVNQLVGLNIATSLKENPEPMIELATFSALKLENEELKTSHQKLLSEHDYMKNVLKINTSNINKTKELIIEKDKLISSLLELKQSNLILEVDNTNLKSQQMVWVEKLQRIENQKDELQQLLSISKIENKVLQDDVKHWRRKNSENLRTIETLYETNNIQQEQTNQYNNEVPVLEAQITQLTKTKGELETKLIETESKFKEMSYEYNGMSKLIELQKQNLTDLSVSNVELMNNFEEWNKKTIDRIECLEIVFKTADSTIEKLNSKYECACNDLKDVMEVNIFLKEELHNKEAQLQDTKNKMNAMIANYNSHKNIENNKTNKTIQELEDLNKNLNENLEKLSQELNHRIEELDMVKTNEMQKMKELDSYINEFNDTKMHNEELTKQLKELQKMHINKIKHLQSTINMRTNQNRTLKNQNNRLVNEKESEYVFYTKQLNNLMKEVDLYKKKLLDNEYKEQFYAKKETKSSQTTGLHFDELYFIYMMLLYENSNLKKSISFYKKKCDVLKNFSNSKKTDLHSSLNRSLSHQPSASHENLLMDKSNHEGRSLSLLNLPCNKTLKKQLSDCIHMIQPQTVSHNKTTDFCNRQYKHSPRNRQSRNYIV